MGGRRAGREIVGRKAGRGMGGRRAGKGMGGSRAGRGMRKMRQYLYLFLWKSVCFSPEYDPHPVATVRTYTAMHKKVP